MYLDELALKYKADKGSHYHNYTLYYDMIFNRIKDEKLKILEIGIAQGSSLKMWKDYFTNSLIYGIDVSVGCKKLEEDRIKIFIGNQEDSVFLNNVKKEINDDIDIFIDDGSHICTQQINTFKIAFPFVRSGGYYIIEDINTSYFDPWKKGSSITCLNFCKNLIDDVNLNGKTIVASRKRMIESFKKQNILLNYYEKNIEYIFFFSGLCIIKKEK